MSVTSAHSAPKNMPSSPLLCLSHRYARQISGLAA